MYMKKKDLNPDIVLLEMTDRIKGRGDGDRINEEIDLLLRQNKTRVIFDLSGVHFIDSAAIGVFVRNFTLLRDSGGSLRLVGVKGMVKGVLEMTNINKVIGMYATIEEACQDSSPPPSPE